MESWTTPLSLRNNVQQYAQGIAEQGNSPKPWYSDFIGAPQSTIHMLGLSLQPFERSSWYPKTQRLIVTSHCYISWCGPKSPSKQRHSYHPGHSKGLEITSQRLGRGVGRENPCLSLGKIKVFTIYYQKLEFQL